jgi:hypothetical protein
MKIPLNNLANYNKLILEKNYSPRTKPLNTLGSHNIYVLL